jgi:hypothetical protein
VKPLVEKLNNRPMRKLKKSRRELFEEVERASLKPLPKTPWEFARWAKPKVNPAYHVEYDDHFYSVPYQLVGQQLDLRATERTIEVMRGLKCITSHARSYRRGGHTTKTEHMPKAHEAQAGMTPQRIIEWAKKTEPSTAALVEEIMKRRVHPQQGFMACQGILHLNRQYELMACVPLLPRRASGEPRGTRQPRPILPGQPTPHALRALPRGRIPHRQRRRRERAPPRPAGAHEARWPALVDGERAQAGDAARRAARPLAQSGAHRPSGTAQRVERRGRRGSGGAV